MLLDSEDSLNLSIWLLVVFVLVVYTSHRQICLRAKVCTGDHDQQFEGATHLHRDNNMRIHLSTGS